MNKDVNATAAKSTGWTESPSTESKTGGHFPTSETSLTPTYDTQVGYETKEIVLLDVLAIAQ